ncbi:MAG TPA: hypothetical protein VFR30_03025 [Lysobacter sp.]|nr:hypothetical protein [Lysobacter sp.]
MPRSRELAIAVVTTLALAGGACRKDPSTTTTTPTDEFGEAGAGYVAQCSGWFPDWISANPPGPEVASFQLAQGYFLGIPEFETVDGEVQVVKWNPPAPATTVASAPWLAHDFHVPAQRLPYLQALLDYVMLGMPEADFVAQANTKRRWYHVPMMTTSPTSRREPYRGTTKERPLNASAHSWIAAGNQLDSFAIGYYNALGSYTLGQVFNNPDPQLSDPSKARFIDGTLVFKLIFAEYTPAKIVAAQDPLVGSPEWQVQDVEAPAAPLKSVRLLQLDIAVRDPRATETGWVFATYVFDKSKAAEPVAWRRLTPVGLQWGNDPDVTGPGVGTLDQSWANTAALPALFQNKLGRDGRLNGPVDNPASSCLSCHSTAQLRTGAAPVSAFRGVRLVPAGACTNAQDMTWFRNLSGSTPFGTMTSNGTGCTLEAAQPATPPLHALDYSLQLADGLESSLFYQNPNPCEATAMAMRAAQKAPAKSAGPMDQRMMRTVAERPGRVKLSKESAKQLLRQDDTLHRR